MSKFTVAAAVLGFIVGVASQWVLYASLLNHVSLGFSEMTIFQLSIVWSEGTVLAVLAGCVLLPYLATRWQKTADSDKAEPSASVERARTRRSTTRAMAMADDNVAERPLTKQKTPAKVKDRPRAIVKIVSGPLAGGEFVLQQGICDKIMIGSAPTRKGHPLTLVDSSVAPNHTCLDLMVKDGVVMVKVTDLKSANGTMFNGKRMASGKTDVAFCGASSIQVGTTVLEILRG
jgi:FHA domain